jgi:hypothetical protein
MHILIHNVIVELGKMIRTIYVDCVGPLDQEVTTMDLLKRIELRMENLTQHLEMLPAEKVKIAQRVQNINYSLTHNDGSCYFLSTHT